MLLLSFFLVTVVFADQLMVINNHLVTIDNNTLKSVRAYDEYYSELQLTGLHLRGVHKLAFEGLRKIKSIDLSKNFLTFLPKFVFRPLKNLEHLSLADNCLTNIKNVFVELNNLKSLDISNNPIKYLGSGVFGGLTKLTDILTSGISFLSITNDLFEKNVNGVIPTDDPNRRVHLCSREGIVRSLQIMNCNEPTSDCEEVKVTDNGGTVSLSRMGISGFEHGWYRLQGLIVTSLNLTNNNIVSVTREMLNDLPNELTHVNLAHNKIRRLAKGVIDNKTLRRITFAFNCISEVDDNALENTKLLILEMTGNRLSSTRFAATLPSTLTRLELRNNDINELSAHSFARLNRLVYLDFKLNHITEIKRDSLRGLSSLRILSFEKNNLRNIELGSFQDLRTLRTLNIRTNRLTNLAKGVFNGLKRVQTIDISINDLTRITRDSLHDLPDTLNELHLIYNQISRLEVGTFVNVPKFWLNLEGNVITEIEQGSFNLPKLEKLSLGRNLLSQLNVGSFQGISRLKHLSLQQNRITNIHKGWAISLGALSFLDISNNPIKRLMKGAFFGLPKVSKLRRRSTISTSSEFIVGFHIPSRGLGSKNRPKMEQNSNGICEEPKQHAYVFFFATFLLEFWL